MWGWLSFRSSGLNTEPTGGKGFASQSRASMLSQLDVFTIDEIARAAGVPRAAVQRLVDSGELKSVAGSGFFDTRAAVLAGIKARREAALAADSQASTLTSSDESPRRTGPFRCRVIIASWGAPRAPDLVNLRSRRHGGKGAPRSTDLSGGTRPWRRRWWRRKGAKSPGQSYPASATTSIAVLRTRTSTTAIESTNFTCRTGGGRQ